MVIIFYSFPHGLDAGTATSTTYNIIVVPVQEQK